MRPRARVDGAANAHRGARASARRRCTSRAPKDISAAACAGRPQRLAPNGCPGAGRAGGRAGRTGQMPHRHRLPASGRDREALGRSRGGLTTKIHLLADRRCRPVARVTTAGQRHDSLAFEPLMGQLRIARSGRGRPRTRPGWLLADKAYSNRKIRAYLRRRRIKATIPEKPTRTTRAAKGSHGGRPPRSTPRPTKIATPSSAPTTSSRRSARSPCAPTNASTSPRHHRRRHDQDLAPPSCQQRSTDTP